MNPVRGLDDFVMDEVVQPAVNHVYWWTGVGLDRQYMATGWAVVLGCVLDCFRDRTVGSIIGSLIVIPFILYPLMFIPRMPAGKVSPYRVAEILMLNRVFLTIVLLMHGFVAVITGNMPIIGFLLYWTHLHVMACTEPPEPDVPVMVGGFGRQFGMEG